jgi:hypothetical protein
LNLNKMLFVLAAAVLCAGVARADNPMPSGSDQTQAAPAAAPAAGGDAAPMKKGDWKAMLKDACSAEIADGGVCAGKEFGSGLEKCLERHRAKESDGCRKAVRRHRRHWMHKQQEMHKDGDTSSAPAAAPADAPAPAPAPAQ